MSGSADIFIGRQPIMDRSQKVAAYELLFRGSATATSAVITDFDRASARVLVDTFGTMGAEAVIGPHLGFVNLTAQMLMSDTLEALPADKVVLEILETIEADSAVRARCEDLKARGFTLALDDYVEDDPRECLLDLVKYVKVDMPAISKEGLPWLVRRLKREKVILLAEKVEEPEEFERYHELGFDLFQGYYFARPATISGKRLDPSRVTLLRLLQQLGRDAEFEEMSESFKMNANLGVNLLRLVNSAAMARTCKITTVQQALVYLGKKQLQRWLNLLLFVGEDHRGYDNPLLQSAAMRGRLMELLAHAKVEGEKTVAEDDGAFLTGMLSLIDVLLGVPKEELIEQLNLDEEIRNALLDHDGELGGMLKIVEKCEQTDLAGMEDLLRGQGLSNSLLVEAQLSAYSWVNGLGSELR